MPPKTRAARKPRGLVDRLDDGPVVCAEGYLFEFERRGYLQAGAYVPEVALEHPDLVESLHRDFVHAGSDVVEAFTYYAHRVKLRNVCQCEEVTRRELVEVRPPGYLKWESSRMDARNLDPLRRDGPVNQDQIKRLTRAGMGPCQGRRCREQVALLLALSAGTSVDRIPMPSYRPPVRPLPLNVLWPTDEPRAMRDDWVSWFGIPTQFSPHWEAGMAIAEPTAQTRLIGE